MLGNLAKEKKKTYNRAYQQLRRATEEGEAQDQAYRLDHQVEKNAKDRAYYHAHREMGKANSHAYRETHREECKIYSRAYRAAHREEERARNQVYGLAHRGEHTARECKRRALKAGATHQPYKVEDIIRRDRGICGLCHKRVAKEEQSIDHILPLSLGGADAPHNVQVAHLRCNSAKNNTARFPANLRLALGS